MASNIPIEPGDEITTVHVHAAATKMADSVAGGSDLTEGFKAALDFIFRDLTREELIAASAAYVGAAGAGQDHAGRMSAALRAVQASRKPKVKPWDGRPAEEQLAQQLYEKSAVPDIVADRPKPGWSGLSPTERIRWTRLAVSQLDELAKEMAEAFGGIAWDVRTPDNRHRWRQSARKAYERGAR